MVERRSELKRRRTRAKKMFKLKARLAKAKEGRERDVIVNKIHIISPWWKDPNAPAAPPAPTPPAPAKKR
jgi:Family of unknown function (DUF6800)